MMHERYWRFYFKDIQAVRLQRTNAHIYWGLLWAALVLGWGLTLLIESFPNPLSLGFGGFFFLLLLINLILGPSCRVHLQTAVQVQQLSGLRRVRKARKVMDRIRQAVERVQGPLDPGATWSGDPLASTAPMTGGLASHQPSGSRVADPSATKKDAVFAPWLHQVLFAALLAAAVFNGWHLFHPPCGPGGDHPRPAARSGGLGHCHPGAQPCGHERAAPGQGNLDEYCFHCHPGAGRLYPLYPRLRPGTAIGLRYRGDSVGLHRPATQRPAVSGGGNGGQRRDRPFVGRGRFPDSPNPQTPRRQVSRR